MTSDPERCKAFYGAVFDWQFDDESMPGYTLVNTGADPGGGVFPKPEDAQAACINVYFKVKDIEAVLVKVTGHGGRVLVPRTEIPNVGYFAMFADPDGIAVGIMQSAD
jgi:predicted enzyme related to lactoylglutathione lyase